MSLSPLSSPSPLWTGLPLDIVRIILAKVDEILQQQPIQRRFKTLANFMANPPTSTQYAFVKYTAREQRAIKADEAMRAKYGRGIGAQRRHLISRERLIKQF